MFMLFPEQFPDNNRGNIVEFINSWSNYYRDTAPFAIDEHGERIAARIDYLQELNMGHPLTAQNITRLLRWKLSRYYTHPRPNGLPNARVVQIIQAIDELNQFRQEPPNEDRFREVTQRLIPTDGTMQIFLFHICRPWEYPIADTNVFRVFYRLTQNQQNDAVTWETYRNGYIPFFEELAQQYGIDGDPMAVEFVQQLKVIDNALVTFGQFLKKYDIQ